MADLKAFAEQLVNLTVKEVNELATILKEEYGIEPAAASAYAIPLMFLSSLITYLSKSILCLLSIRFTSVPTIAT